MKIKNQKIITILLALSLCLIIQINSLSYTYHDIIHINSEFAKVCTLKDGNVLVFSSAINTQEMLISKLNNKGRFVYQNATLNKGYTADAQLSQISDSDNYIFAHHNRHFHHCPHFFQKTLFLFFL